MIQAFGISDAGPGRSVNEDCLVLNPALSLYAVADGMGGRPAGEVAAKLAVESIENFINRSQDSDDVSWPFGVDPALSFNANRLKTAVSLANRRVFRVAESHDDYLGMGTTVVCALVSGRQLIFAHVGDSRLYLLAAGTLAQLTQDDTWAATVLAAGYTRDTGLIEAHPNRNVLTNVLGAQQHTSIHISERELSDGETILLCSDGLHSSVGDAVIADLLAGDETPGVIARRLIDEAQRCGARDDATALVMRFVQDGQ